jgi:hypothetical protein
MPKAELSATTHAFDEHEGVATTSPHSAIGGWSHGKKRRGRKANFTLTEAVFLEFTGQEQKTE